MKGKGVTTLLVAIIVIVCKLHAHAKLLAAFVMPHGGIALDPSFFNTTNTTAKLEAWEIHKACISVGKQIQRLRPDLIFLSTPHGIADLQNFIFYLNSKAAGSADTDNCACPPCCYNVSVDVNANVSRNIVSVFGRDRNVSGVSGYGPPGGTEPFPLRWGEVIPLHFIEDGVRIPVAILSQPSRRYTEDVAMIPELLKLGNDLYDYLDNLDQKVIVVVSADLAHTHQADGPYGYSNTSEPFDLAVGEWASTLNSEALLIRAAGFVDRALSCGYTGLVMLHGMLANAGLSSWQPDLLVNHHPSYYGMMVAAFTRQDEAF